MTWCILACHVSCDRHTSQTHMVSQAHVTDAGLRHMSTQTPIPCPTWKESSRVLMKSSETSEMWASPVKVLLCSSTKAPKASRRLILPFTTSPFFRSPMSVQLPSCLSFSVISTLQTSHDTNSELRKMRRFIPAKDKHRLQHVQCQAPEAIHLFLTCRMLSTVAACSVTIVAVLQQTQ